MTLSFSHFEQEILMFIQKRVIKHRNQTERMIQWNQNFDLAWRLYWTFTIETRVSVHGGMRVSSGIISIFITRVSEVIMFSPCVFVTLFVCLCLYHDVCPDDLTMKDWCHTNNIVQVHCWGCLVVQVMFHALMTSSMASPGHKVGQILKVIYLRQILS